MKTNKYKKNSILNLATLVLIFGVSSCSSISIKPIHNLNLSIEGFFKELKGPNLKNNWLASISFANEKERIELFNLKSKRPVSLPGSNRAGYRPINVSVSSNGNRLAILRERNGQVELII